MAGKTFSRTQISSVTPTAGNAKTAGVSLASCGVVANQAGGSISGNYGVVAGGYTNAVTNRGIVTGNDARGSGVSLRSGVATNEAGGTISGNYGVVTGSINPG